MSRRLGLGPKASIVSLSGGAGQATAGPTAPGEIWNVTGIAVGCATNVNEAACSVYLAPVGPFNLAAAQLLGATSTGSSGDSFGPVVELVVGQELVAVWSGGDATTQATMTYWGSRQVP